MFCLDSLKLQVCKILIEVMYVVALLNTFYSWCCFTAEYQCLRKATWM